MMQIQNLIIEFAILMDKRGTRKRTCKLGRFSVGGILRRIKPRPI